jgi:hypothetical protein
VHFAKQGLDQLGGFSRARFAFQHQQTAGDHLQALFGFSGK